jgi:hypothetical protein
MYCIENYTEHDNSVLNNNARFDYLEQVGDKTG